MNKYQIKELIDEGAYGHVLLAQNKLTNTMGNLKVDVFLIGKGIFFQYFNYAKKICLTQYKSFLQEFKSINYYQPQIIRFIIFQLTRCIQFLHSKNVIHRDIKPENLLLTKNLTLKICDFGFARHIPKNNNEFMTEYVSTRWYRSPQLLVGDYYGPPVDIWNIGCIMCQMLDGIPLFPGQSDIDQIFLIQNCLGKLSNRMINIFSTNSIYDGIQFPLPQLRETLQMKYLGKATKLQLSFIKQCLFLDPKQRATAQTLLNHPYLLPLTTTLKKSQKLKEIQKINSCQKLEKVQKKKIEKEHKIIKNNRKEFRFKKNCGIIIINYENSKNNTIKVKELKQKEHFKIQSIHNDKSKKKDKKKSIPEFRKNLLFQNDFFQTQQT